MRRYTIALALALPLAFLALAIREGNEAQAQQVVPEAVPVLQAADTFAQGLSQANKATVQGVACPELWNRLKSNFETTPGPATGAFGTFTRLDTGQFVRPGYALVHLLCKHADGVEDALIITLKQVNGSWRVCGGPTAMSPANPLR